VIEVLHALEGALMDFRDKDIELFWINPGRYFPRRVPASLRRVLYRKLQILEAASHINDLRVPPGNRLEKLSGDREGQHSIRINKQWRLCFIWTTDGVKGVELSDYHK